MTRFLICQSLKRKHLSMFLSYQLDNWYARRKLKFICSSLTSRKQCKHPDDLSLTSSTFLMIIIASDETTKKKKRKKKKSRRTSGFLLKRKTRLVLFFFLSFSRCTIYSSYLKTIVIDLYSFFFHPHSTIELKQKKRNILTSTVRVPMMSFVPRLSFSQPCRSFVRPRKKKKRSKTSLFYMCFFSSRVEIL